MIRVGNLHLYRNERPILQGVSFEVRTGETLAIIGESGGGKTSLARLLLGLLNGTHARPGSHRHGFCWSGAAYVDELDVLRASRTEIERQRGKTIGLIVQALSDALNPHLTVRQHVREVLALHADARIDVENACNEWNIPVRIRDRFPAGLSGGEVQRVLTALALLPGPTHLILDEPTASLDHRNRQKAIEAFRRGRSSRCQLLITHDLALARQLADRIAILQNGRIVECGVTRDILRGPICPYTESLLAAADELRHSPAPAPAARSSPCDTTAMAKRYPSSHSTATQAGLYVQHLTHSFGDTPLFRDLSFHVPKGQCLAILGPSGSGKSTLARVLAGYEALQSGAFEWRDSRGPNGLARSSDLKAALVSQHPHRAMPRHFTVSDVLAEALGLARRRDAERDEIGALLGMVSLPAEAGFLMRPSAALSGGEAQRLVIARALAARPHYIVADEPTASLDAISRTKILQLLRQLQEANDLTVVLVTHEPEVANYLSHPSLHLSIGT